MSNPGELSCAPEPCRTTSENEFCGESALIERREDDWPAVGIEIGWACSGDALDRVKTDGGAGLKGPGVADEFGESGVAGGVELLTEAADEAGGVGAARGA
jgi:hypothetical protein